MKRSGLNWVRYCIEHFTGRRMPGRAKLVHDGEPVVYRTHDVRRRNGPDSCNCAFFDEDGRPLHHRVVLILRHVHESFVRTNWPRCDPLRVDPSETAASIRGGNLKGFKKYFDNILAFERFDGPKLLVRYEELVSGMDGVYRIMDFLELPYGREDFDEAAHRERSIAFYEQNFTAFTRNAPTNLSFHRDRVDPVILNALDALIEEHYSHVPRHYLVGVEQ